MLEWNLLLSFFVTQSRWSYASLNILKNQNFKKILKVIFFHFSWSLRSLKNKNKKCCDIEIPELVPSWPQNSSLRARPSPCCKFLWLALWKWLVWQVRMTKSQAWRLQEVKGRVKKNREITDTLPCAV